MHFEHAGGLFGAAKGAGHAAVAANLEPIVSALQVAGYVTQGPEGCGWTATAVGCALIERSRALRAEDRAYVPRNL